MALILSDKIKIVSIDDFTASEIQQIDVRLRTLIMCTENTIPGSRFFGLPRDYLDAQMNEASTMFAAELQEKAAYYIPEISVESIETTYNLDGKLELKINIERRDEDDS